MFSHIRRTEGKLREAAERREICQREKMVFKGKWKQDLTHIWRLWIDHRQCVHRIRAAKEAELSEERYDG